MDKTKMLQAMISATAGLAQATSALNDVMALLIEDESAESKPKTRAKAKKTAEPQTEPAESEPLTEDAVEPTPEPEVITESEPVIAESETPAGPAESADDMEINYDYVSEILSKKIAAAPSRSAITSQIRKLMQSDKYGNVSKLSEIAPELYLSFLDDLAKLS